MKNERIGRKARLRFLKYIDAHGFTAIGRAAFFILHFSFFILHSPQARSQYYDWGNSPASIRWDQMRSPDVRLIYPRTFEDNARRMMHYFDTVRPHISHGYRHGTMHTPVILHTQNMTGNGIVLWAPKRIELLSAPGSTYSEPWLKQLAIHEYRHNVQYNNLDKSTLRVLSWVLGQQIKFLGQGMLGMFLLEGDAVMAETEMSAFGRGLQPSFTMHYRAVGDVGSDRYAKDYWFCGSYRDYVPDHYQLGYQMVRWGYDQYGENFLDPVLRYISRNPQFIFPMNISLKKYYKTNSFGLFRDAFADLNRHWDSLPETDDSAEKIVTPTTSYTTYQWPLWLDDETLVVFKKDLDRPSRIVMVDAPTGREKHIAYTGIVSSRPELRGDAVVWTEFDRSTLWGERMNSRIRLRKLDGLRTHTFPERDPQMYYPAFGRDAAPAFVAYHRETGLFSIEGNAAGPVVFPMGTEITGLAWDNATDRFYFIGLDDRGMWLGRVNTTGGGYEQLTPARHITISDLRARDGKLWFGSIVSGKDEAHCYEIATGREYRLTTSKYGSFQPSPNPSGTRVALTTYDKDGYKLSVQDVAGAVVQEQRELPVDLVNPDRKGWNMPKMDSMVFSDRETAVSKKKYTAKRYRKALNLFYLHSWVPLDFYPPAAIEEMDLTMNLGATVMSQSLLSDMTSRLGYGWNRAQGSMLKGGFTYSGLGPHLDVGFTWGGANQTVYSVMMPTDIEMKKFFSVNTRLSLPMVIGSGYTYRSLTPAIEYYYTNGLIFEITEPTAGTLTRGVERMNFSLTYAQQTRMAQRDLLPRWGFAARGSYILNPSNRNFMDLYSVFARGYLPGILPHHSTTLRANWQETIGDASSRPYSFHMKELFPRGATYNFATKRWASGSVDYQFPVWHPEGGIPGLLYFKRLRLNLFFDYAQWQSHKEIWNPLYSYGGDIILDITPLRMPAAADMSAKLTIAKPSDRRGVAVMFGISVPL